MTINSEATYSEFIPQRKWWKSAVVYQIYPISFFDSNGDGIGDLNGIHEKLDYIKDLGVDVIWICPIYKSPLADMGYDISDYRDIDPRYGTLEDWDRLLEGVHARGMRLLMDIVANHTSNQHPWFEESRSSRDSTKRDWYIWRPAKVDANGHRQPPNNWESFFRGSTWEWDNDTEEYYLHLFAKEQPDLNWENPVVRDVVYDTMEFWLKRGADGFRMDAINLISKTPGLPDVAITNPAAPHQPAATLFVDGPRIHEFIQEMNSRVLSKYDVMTVGETQVTHDPADIAAYVLPSRNEFNMVFQSEVMDIDHGGAEDGVGAINPLLHRPWKLTEVKKTVGKWQMYKREEGYWNTVYIGSHDYSRPVSRYGNDSVQWRALSAKLLALLQTTQSGTLYVYQGEEIGMKNFPLSWGIEEYKDVASINFWNEELEKRRAQLGLSSGDPDPDMSDILDGLQKKARDHARTPFQWETSLPHAGFTTGTPWMRVNDDYSEGWAANAQISDPRSVLSFWRSALRMRKEYEVFVYGDFKLLLPEDEKVFAYRKELDDIVVVVVLNFGIEEVEINEEKLGTKGMKVLIGNYEEMAHQTEGESNILLKGYEGRVYVRA